MYRYPMTIESSLRRLCSITGKSYTDDYKSTSTVTEKFFEDVLSNNIFGQYRHMGTKTATLEKLYKVDPSYTTRAGITLSGLEFYNRLCDEFTLD